MDTMNSILTVRDSMFPALCAIVAIVYWSVSQDRKDKTVDKVKQTVTPIVPKSYMNSDYELLLSGLKGDKAAIERLITLAHKKFPSVSRDWLISYVCIQ